MSTGFKSLLLVTLVVGVHLQSATIELHKQVRQQDGKFLSLASGVVDLGNKNNLSYYGQIGFGKNTQTGEINWAPVIFDTGSSWLWVATEGCECSGVGSGVYVNLKDTDFKSSNQEVKLAYGKGQGQGELGTMTIYLTEEVSYAHQAMIGMQSDSGFNGGYTSGIFGLSHKAGANNTPTLIDNLYANGTIAQKLFTISLRNESQQSLITVGEVSYTNVVAGAEFKYVNLNLTSSDKYYYTFLVDEVQLGSTTASNHYAIADTGTSLLCIPPTLADPFFEDSAFDGCDNQNGLRICECSARSSFPSLKFTIGGTVYEITNEEYLIEDQGYCVVGIETITPPGGLIVLGDIFLRNVVAVFDLGNETVGFAPATQ
eukprot:CAMPEP_0114983644 /NCGR_PEP_ID=MMETSP0216-20121206/6817_1 /TAXON_ID=223996 /ORGANISM="Protocruzia adherens, Strain Boccale" /LENGTH=371 /DNA_ID=CAMNT_0002345655 /DNA_START=21 /DNA_END=1136 /DNA_ORIENTATION=-